MWPPTKSPSRFKEKVEIAQALFTIAQAIFAIAAIIVGGLWTYNLFIKERHEYPHANIELKLSHVALSDRVNLLRVWIELTNGGSSLMKIGKSIIRVQQILPSVPCPKQDGACAANEVDAAIKEVERHDDRFNWALIAERTDSWPSFDIEPGEKQSIDFEFATPSEVKAVRVYAYFRNDQKSSDASEVGWDTSNYYDFPAPAKGGSR
jgi:hypothetical protein